MLPAMLIDLIVAHADALTQSALTDLATNPWTRSFRFVPPDELEARIFATYHNLSEWIGDSSDDGVRAEYESWGAERLHQGIPLSEIVYALILVKRHLRRLVRNHGLAEFSGDRGIPDDRLEAHPGGIWELNDTVGQFFDRAMYYLARGYEQEAARWPAHAVAARRT
jgi:hypothetical protein